MTIDHASTHDLDALAALYQELVGERTDIQRAAAVFERILSDPHYHLLVARDEFGCAIATAMGILCYDLTGACRPFMVIENVIISTLWRKKGVGNRIMLELERLARENGCAYCMLNSSMSRAGAHRFYERLGYPTDAVKGYRKYL